MNPSKNNAEFDNKNQMPDVTVIPDVNTPKNATTTPIAEDELTVDFGKQNDDHKENSQNNILRRSDKMRIHNLSPENLRKATSESNSSADSATPLITET